MDLPSTPGDRRARAGLGIWVGWALALLGGIAVLTAAVALTRVDLAAACAPAAACADALSPLTGALAFGGTVLAVVGATTATVLTWRRSGRRRTR